MKRLTQSWTRSLTQWPTLGLLSFCYTAIASITYFAPVTSHWFAIPAFSIMLALHSSLQHELLHGNPFKQSWLNDLIAFPAVGLLVPYLRFKETHLAHHLDENLTDPYDDPEAQYLDPKRWVTHPRWLQRIYRCNNTLLGRMILGPFIGMLCFYRADAKRVLRGEHSITQAYAWHIAGVALAAVWVIGIAEWTWLQWLASAYGAMLIVRIRTYLEHQAHENVPARTAIVQDRGPLAWLFLFNNFHCVHHQHPRMPWYKLPGYYRKHQPHFDQLNEHYTFAHYGEVFKQFLFRAKDPVPHPLMQASKKTPL